MGDRPYLAAGNVWLLMALVLRLGQRAVRFEPTRYSLFGVGGWLSPAAYWFLVIACLCLGVGLMCSRKRP